MVVNKHSLNPFPKVFIGILTSSSTWDARGQYVLETWARKFGDDFKFFVGDEFSTNQSSHYVKLDTEDLIYPPQEKSFLMLKYMYQNLADKYEWFVRADDDVYIISENLKEFLSHLDHNKQYYIGRIGFGLEYEKHLLGLSGMGFCMGGTSVIMSQRTVKTIGPHIDACLTSAVSKHEDTELGRCIYRYAKISCSEEMEVKNMFIHSKNRIFSRMRDQRIFSMMNKLAIHPLRKKSQFMKMRRMESKILKTKTLLKYYRLKYNTIENSNYTSQRAAQRFSQIDIENFKTKQPHILDTLNANSYLEVKNIIEDTLKTKCDLKSANFTISRLFYTQTREKTILLILAKLDKQTQLMSNNCKSEYYNFEIEHDVLSMFSLENVIQIKRGL